MITLKDEKPLAEAVKAINLLLLDVDGVLTNGQLYFSNGGEEIKAFNSLDGHGIKMLQAAGIEVGIITGRRSELVNKRAADLGIGLLYQGREDKLIAMEEIVASSVHELSGIAYVGDDLPDIPAIAAAGVGFTVKNCHADLLQIADLQTSRAGGSGAVREVCDYLLKAQNLYPSHDS